ncbi:tetratricopeptide repeat protein [uncultured Bacteroides sp.]|uniref:tetratricopeptide repeat protein n=1 Tax=uncultured Bacteroides sp. TaxID=162156 RepID=UPI002AA6B3F7|nr:tetratricopeptide repeat protein [uncultured Bacteroides sp.]
MRSGLILLFIFSVISSVLVSCGDRSRPNFALIEADSLLSANPHEALRLLQKIKPAFLSSEKEAAYYALLFVQATDKSELTLLPCDSLVDVALDYYGGGLNKAKALFYKGRILVKMGLEREAMACYFRALPELGNSYPEIRVKGMVYEDLGRIDLDQSLYRECLNKLDISLRYYSSIQDKKAMINALSLMSSVYTLEEKKEQALFTLHKSLDLATKLGDSLQISNVFHDFCLCYDNFNEPDTALIYAHKSLEYLPENRDSAPIFLSIGILLLEKDRKDSARYYLEKSLDDNIRDQAITHSYLSDLEKESGDYRGALEHLEKYADVVDSLFVADKSSQIERLGYKYETEAKIAKHKAEMRQINILIVSVSIIAILILVLIIERANRRKKVAKLVYEQQAKKMKSEMERLQGRINENLDLIDYLRQEQQSHESEISLKELEIKELSLQKARLRNTLFRQSAIYKKIEKMSTQDASDKKDIKVLTLAEQEALKKAVFEIYDEYIAYLHASYPRMTEDDLLYSCLEIAELNSFTIALCFGNYSTQVVNQRRYRLKSKMTSED